MRFLLLSLTLLCFSLSTYALEVEYFDFTNSKTYALTDDALLTNSLVNNKYPWMFTAAYDFVKTPLSVQNDNERTSDIVKNLQGLHLGGGYRVLDSLFIGARTYVATINSATDGTYLGDSVLEAKWRFWQNETTAIALAPSIYIPTGTSSFTTDGRKVGEYLGLNLEKNFQWIQLSLMAGYSNKPGATFSYGSDYSALNYKQSIYTAIGSIIPLLLKDWALNVEAYRYNQLKGNQHPNEFYVGLRNQTTNSFTSFIGASFGGLVDKTSNDYRISAGIKYTPYTEEPVKPVVQPKPAPTPEPVAAAPVSKREEGLKKEKSLYGTLISAESIYFANGASKIDGFSKEMVQKFHNTIKKLQTKYTVVLEGFASKKGDPANNLKLSRARIKAAEEYLLGLGIHAEKIVEVAYGDSAADLTISESLNRKVMLRLYRK